LLLAPVFGWLAAGANRSRAPSVRSGGDAVAAASEPVSAVFGSESGPAVSGRGELGSAASGGESAPAGSSVVSAVLTWVWAGGGARRLAAAAIALVAALAVCAPWAARNCARMGRCALVSYNGGWNLLIGADEASTGTWAEIKVPPPCREVWDEAAKDACFGEAARRYIAQHPGAWLALAPKKLAATFDYSGAGAWYLHTASAAAFPERAKVALGAVETVFERLALLVALFVAAWPAVRAARRHVIAKHAPRRGDATHPDGIAPSRAALGGEAARTPDASSQDEAVPSRAALGDEAARLPGAPTQHAARPFSARAALTLLLALPAAASVFWLHVWIGYLLLPLVLLAAPGTAAGGPAREDAAPRPALITTAAATIASLCVAHAVFFGAGRYSLVAFPFVTAVAALAFARRSSAIRPPRTA
jgi:hypothetical protein